MEGCRFRGRTGRERPGNSRISPRQRNRPARRPRPAVHRRSGREIASRGGGDEADLGRGRGRRRRGGIAQQAARLVDAVAAQKGVGLGPGELLGDALSVPVSLADQTGRPDPLANATTRPVALAFLSGGGDDFSSRENNRNAMLASMPQPCERAAPCGTALRRSDLSDPVTIAASAACASLRRARSSAHGPPRPGHPAGRDCPAPRTRAPSSGTSDPPACPGRPSDA